MFRTALSRTVDSNQLGRQTDPILPSHSLGLGVTYTSSCSLVCCSNTPLTLWEIFIVANGTGTNFWHAAFQIHSWHLQNVFSGPAVYAYYVLPLFSAFVLRLPVDGHHTDYDPIT